MLIIADYRLPEKALQRLSLRGDMVLLKTDNVVYDSISGHPDIFLCHTPAGVIVAPQTPAIILEALQKHRIPYFIGQQAVGQKHPETTHYNAMVTDKYIIHNQQHTDPVILEKNHALQPIHINQSYSRCSLFHLKDHIFLTSDKGIQKALDDVFEMHYFSPENIVLPHQKHGFLGGCFGKSNDSVYVTGSLKNIPNHKTLQDIIISNGFTIFELHDGDMIDGGGILFLP